jgi:hypothetical protein
VSDSRRQAEHENHNQRRAARRAGRRVAILVAGLASLPGCQPGPRETDARPGAETPDSAPLWSQEGVVAQPRMEPFARRASAAGYAPGSTAWRLSPGAVPAALAGTHPTPGGLLHAVVAALEWPAALGEDAWEHTSRVWMDGERRAVGVALLWGLMDDSVVGHDVRVHMVRAGTGWRIDRVEERFHCGRGVSDDDLCV